MNSASEMIGSNSLQEEVIDYLELSIYSAAEHIDDVESIIRCFFGVYERYDKIPAVRRFKEEIKPIRTRLSGFANAIKHRQSRIRLLHCDFEHGGHRICLHGFFIEEFKDGACSPSPIFHSGNQKVISVTSFAWSVLIYIYSISNSLCSLLNALNIVETYMVEYNKNDLLAKCVVGLVRLPLYSFDDIHPFHATRVIMRFQSSKLIDSGLYGSLSRRWSKSSKGGFNRIIHGYEGDGVTRKFNLNPPNALSLEHWD
ncbi:hypothetical protein MCBRY_002321 [Methylocystis bryophila]